jgi:hypothetical protein
MSYPETAIDKITVELSDLAKAYAEKAANLASDPYLSQAILRSSVSRFVWALYHAFNDELERDVLNQELKMQSAKVDEVISNKTGAVR